MTPTPKFLLVAACAGILALGSQARAQFSDGSNIHLDAPGILLKKPKPGGPEVKAQPLAWPRLDPGAILCRSEGDLNRLAARRAGEAVSGTVDCQIIRAPTAISITERKGPGRTAVQIADTNNAQTGWTDAWLPEKAPSLATPAGRPVR